METCSPNQQVLPTKRSSLSKGQKLKPLHLANSEDELLMKAEEKDRDIEELLKAVKLLKAPKE